MARKKMIISKKAAKKLGDKETPPAQKPGEEPAEAEEPATGEAAAPAEDQPAAEPQGAKEPGKPLRPIVLSEAPEGTRPELRFLCCGCGKKLAVPEDAAGRTIRCPQCGNEVIVPEPAAEPRSPRQESEGLSYVMPATFKFYCTRCAQSLEVAREDAGTETECPSCGNVISVPSPPDE